MTDEEKKAIENLKGTYWYVGEEGLEENIKVVLNLVEKQSKEIEELKKPKYLLNAKTGEITTINNSEFISKDKIKAKIEELEKAYEDSKNEDGESEYYYPNYTIEVLQSLLAKDLEKCERKD